MVFDNKRLLRGHAGPLAARAGAPPGARLSVRIIGIDSLPHPIVMITSGALPAYGAIVIVLR